MIGAPSHRCIGHGLPAVAEFTIVSVDGRSAPDSSFAWLFRGDRPSPHVYLGRCVAGIEPDGWHVRLRPLGANASGCEVLGSTLW